MSGLENFMSKRGTIKRRKRQPVFRADAALPKPDGNRAERRAAAKVARQSGG